MSSRELDFHRSQIYQLHLKVTAPSSSICVCWGEEEGSGGDEEDARCEGERGICRRGMVEQSEGGGEAVCCTSGRSKRVVLPRPGT